MTEVVSLDSYEQGRLILSELLDLLIEHSLNGDFVEYIEMSQDCCDAIATQRQSEQYYNLLRFSQKIIIDKTKNNYYKINLTKTP